MAYFWRGLFVAAALLIMITPLSFAQDAETLRLEGSGIVIPLVEELATASELALETSVTGTETGLADFCTGTTDIAASSRPLTPAEEALCAENEIEFTEILIGHNVLALVVNPAADFAACLAITDLNALLAPSAVGTTNWNEIFSENDLGLSVLVPPAGSAIYAMLDALVPGDGFRSDASVTDVDAIIAAVNETPGALGAVDLARAQAAGDQVRIVELNTSQSGNICVTPSAENVEERLYAPSLPLLLYVGDEQIENISGLVDLLATPEGNEIVSNAGFTPVSASAIETLQETLSEGESGRVFSRDVSGFEIPPGLFGEVRVGGDPIIAPVFSSIATNLTANEPNLTITSRFEGDTAGIRRLCNAELDFIFTSQTLSDEQQEACAANDVETLSFALGATATVLLANAEDNFALCLTTDQIQTIWAASNAEAVANWQTVGESFPDLDLTLFAEPSSSLYSDLLFQQAGVLRPDAEPGRDPLYRAAATANVPGALTYVSWNDYGQVMANDQQNIQLVAVDAGNGCVVPSEETILDGGYVLSYPLNLIVRQTALSNISVQSVLWTVFSDVNFSGIESLGLAGLSFRDLPNLRSELEIAFSTANEAATEAAAEQSSEAEATPEASAEATAEATEDGS